MEQTIRDILILLDRMLVVIEETQVQQKQHFDEVRVQLERIRTRFETAALWPPNPV